MKFYWIILKWNNSSQKYSSILWRARNWDKRSGVRIFRCYYFIVFFENECLVTVYLSQDLCILICWGVVRKSSIYIYILRCGVFNWTFCFSMLYSSLKIGNHCHLLIYCAWNSVIKPVVLVHWFVICRIVP